MSSYLIRYESGLYANDELYINAVTEGERSFIKMLSDKTVEGTSVLGQSVYPVSAGQEKACRLFNPEEQDFDAAYRYLNVLSKDTIREIQQGTSDAFPGAAVITLTSGGAPELFKYRRVSFLKVRDFTETRKYKLVPRLAAVKVCGRLYIALNTVDVRVDKPVIVTIEDEPGREL